MPLKILLDFMLKKGEKIFLKAFRFFLLKKKKLKIFLAVTNYILQCFMR